MVMRPRDSTASCLIGGSPASSLCSKFEQLEKKWSLYNKFDDSEKKWSQLNVIAREKTGHNIIKVEDLEKKWVQLNAFNKQKRREELEVAPAIPQAKISPSPLQEARDQVEAQAEVKVVCNKPKFVLKKRPKRPNRRLLNLTKIRHWNFPHKRQHPEADDAEQSQDEEVLFEPNEISANKPDAEGLMNTSPSTDSSAQSCESRDEQNAYEEIAQRVLPSMPNHQLWQSHETISDYPRENAAGDAMPDVWSPPTDLGIDAAPGSDAPPRDLRSHQPSISDAAQLETIEFTSVERNNILKALKPELLASAWQQAEEQRQDAYEIPVACGIDLVSDIREKFQKCKGDAGKVEMWIKEEMMKSSTVNPDLTPQLSEASSGRENVLRAVVRDLLHQRLCSVSVVLIQSWVRMKLARRAYLRTNSSAGHSLHETRRRRDLLSPTKARIKSVRKSQNERYRRYATTIQSAYRAWSHRIAYVQLRDTTITIQRFFRSYLLGRRLNAAAIQIQQYWLDQHFEDSDWSIDGSGVSSISFDNSHLHENPPTDVEFVPAISQRPHYISLSPEDQVPASPIHNPLPPLPPSSPRPPRRSSSLRHHSSSKPTLPPSLPPLPPAPRSRESSPNRNQPDSGPPKILFHKRKLPPQKEKRSPLSSLRSSKRSMSLGRPSRHESFSPPGGRHRRRASSSVSPSRIREHKFSPAGETLSYGSVEVPSVPQRSANHSLRSSTPSRARRIKAVGIGNKRKVDKAEKQNVACGQQPYGELGTTQHAQGKLTLKGSQAAVNASMKIQKRWRSHRARIAAVSLLLLKWSAGCDFKNGRVSRDRQLRQRAQLLALTRAIGQVGSSGAKRRLSIGMDQIEIEWEGVIFLHFSMPGGRVVSSLSTVHVASVVQCCSLLESISKRKLLDLIAKASLERHIHDQQNRVSRMSMFDRSLTRRRAPVEKEAAVQIQKVMRRCLSRWRFLGIKECAHIIQRNFRSWRCRKAFVVQRYAAVKIQAFFRGELVRGIVFQYWAAAIVLRVFWNGYRQKRLTWAGVRVSKIQGVFRGIQTRKQIATWGTAATAIQAKYRSTVLRRKFLSLRHICLSLQMLMRQKIAQRNVRERDAALFIQHWWRFELFNFRMRCLCATIIETSYRCYRDYTKYKQLHGAIVTIQCTERGRRDRKHIALCHQSAVVIQSILRGSMLRQNLALCATASTAISSWYRGTSQKRILSTILLRNRCATLVQKTFRRFSQQVRYRNLCLLIKVLQFQTR
jgi:hypothetical protein